MFVSVGMPFFNCEKTLEVAIRSVFAQSFTDWELILVDDGSSDRSLEIARLVDDPRIRVITDGVNRGLHYRLNQIAQLAQGELIARMDSDDIMHPDRLLQQVRYLEEHSDVDVVGSVVYCIDEDGIPRGMRGEGPLRATPAEVIRAPILPHPTVIAAADWFRANPYDDNGSRAEDYELWCRTCQTTKFVKLDVPLLYYRDGFRPAAKYLRDYLETSRTVRKVLIKYGPECVGWPRTLMLIGASKIKADVYRLATALGMQQLLLKRRNRNLSRQELQEAVTGLRVVMKTRVPGMD